MGLGMEMEIMQLNSDNNFISRYIFIQKQR